MNRTHAFLALAAALTLTATFQPAARWLERRTQTPVVAAPRASIGGAMRLDAAISHGQPLEGGATYLRYDVRASDAKLEGSQPVQLALVIDRSGSMAGEKIARARAAALEFVELLRPEDQLAVITFGSDTTELPLLYADLGGKQRMREFISQITDSGGTNISGGLERARALLQAAPATGVRRVVLMSDGQPTEGRTNVEDLVNLTVNIHESRMAVSALGIGYDFNGTLMQRLAERGGGFYAYLNDSGGLSEVLKLELAQARGAVARNVSLRVELSGGAELLQVAGREITRNGNVVIIPLPDFAPGQTAQAFLEVKLPAGTVAMKASARLEYFDPNGNTSRVGDTAELAANTTADESVAEGSKDAVVASECIRAVGATKLVAAADAFERGDRKSAFELLTNARSIFAMSADSLAGELTEVTAAQKRWENTHDAQGVAHEAKSMNRKSMVNFGENNAY
jgi:Ca-activated chloride channel family protein